MSVRNYYPDCPECGSEDTRLAKEGDPMEGRPSTYRCADCHHRFTHYDR